MNVDSSKDYSSRAAEAYGARFYPDVARERPGILDCRVSTAAQRSNGTHRGQWLWAVDQVERAGGRLLYPGYVKVASGRLESILPDLVKKFDRCRREGALYIAPNLFRIFRPMGFYDIGDFDAWPTPDEFEAVFGEARARGVIVSTLLSPEASPQEIRSVETRIGMERARAKGKHVGRPYTDRSRLPELLAAGYSHAEIARKFDRPKSTVQGWIRELGPGV